MWIQNVSADDIQKGNHPFSDNTILIQISDDGAWFPVPQYNFARQYQFMFFDVENTDENVDQIGITDMQAQQLVDILKLALDENCNVLVHCVAGLCRSGAVCEVGVMMGFEDTGRRRQPNLRVKSKMMRVLGWTYD